MATTETDLTTALGRQYQRLIIAATVAFGVLPAILFLLGLMIVHDFSLQARLRAEMRTSYAERGAIREAFALLQDAETGQRGYLLTGDPQYLKPYEDASRAIPAEISQLRAIARGRATDLADIDRLDQLSRSKLAELHETVELRRLGKSDEALAIVKSNRGKVQMDRIREVEAAIDGNTARIGAAKLSAADAALGKTMAAAIALALLFVASMAVTGAIVFGSFRHRRQLFGRVVELASRQSAVLDSAVDAIISLNPSGTIETINAAGERMFGYTAEALDRRDMGVLLDLELKGEGTFLERLGVATDKGCHSVVREGYGITRDGRRFPVDVALGPMPLDAGVYVAAIVRDISERRRAEEIKDQFISAVSHELRTPLTSITGSLGLLKGGAVGALPPAAERLIGIAHSNSDRLGRLVNDILDIEKIQSGRMPFADEPVDLKAVFRATVEEMEGYARQYGVSLQAPADVRPLWTRGDAQRLGQVAANLISNAIKFSPEGGAVRIAFAQREGIQQVSVSDDGPGIPEAFRARIFSRFAQADNSDTRQRGGTGLGLAICKEIVERHEGRLFFKSEAGKGTRFFLNMPTHSVDAPQADAAPATAAPTTAAPGPALPRVLVCEDDLEVCEFLGALIKAEGGEPELVHSLKQAKVALAQGGYACALLDLNLPDGSGLEFLQGVPAPRGAPPLPVVIVSARERRHLGQVTGGLKVVDWVEKPIAPARLRQSLRKALEIARAQRATVRPPILHVEDDPDVVSLVRDLLQDVGMVESVSTLAAAKHALATRPPRLVILDMGLADGSGAALLPFLADAKGGHVPTIVFSAQDGEPAADRADVVLTKSKASLGQLALEAHRLLHPAPAEQPNPEQRKEVA